MRIKQVFVLPETDLSKAGLYILSEDGVLYYTIINESTNMSEPKWFKITPPTDEIAGSINVRLFQNGTAGKPQVGECNTSAIA